MAIYTKKGGPGTLGFNDMTAVTQILETLLEKLRRQEMTLTEEMSSALLEASDVIAKQSTVHREGGKVDANAVSAICTKLERFLSFSNQDEANSHSGSAAGQKSGNAANQPNDSDYGFFGQQPQVQTKSEEQDDYGFFKEK